MTQCFSFDERVWGDETIHLRFEHTLGSGDET